MKRKQKIRKILRKSKEVIKNSSLKNRAILAADVFNPLYPKNAKWYGYVWPRDASFTVVAADILGMKKIGDKFFEWLWEFADGIKESGLVLAQKYFPNGVLAFDHDITNQKLTLKNYLENILERKMKFRTFQLQVDQNGFLLWSLYFHSKHSSKINLELVKKLCFGICKIWKKDHFILDHHDMWEERVAKSKLKQIHTASLAIVIKGLENGLQLIGENKQIQKCVEQMKKVLEKCYDKRLGYFIRTYGKKKDVKIDSSVLTLVWPSEQFSPFNKKIENTIKKIESENILNGGVFRYKNDRYDGRTKFGILNLGGAGSWPILNFWISIYYSLRNEREKALNYYNCVIDKVPSHCYIPEQFKNNKPQSIIPLTWSHSMFVIASKFLNFI